MSMSTRDAIHRLLDAVNRRDIRAISSALHPEASWANVPHSPALGRDAVVGMLAPIVRWSDAVDWEIVSEQYSEGTGWVERVDRFEIAGHEHAVRCNGVFLTAATPAGEVVVAVRDYVDLGEWRARIGPVYEMMATRSPEQVVGRHLDFVRRGDVIGMGLDYSADAELVRRDATDRGWSAIADYFEREWEPARGMFTTFEVQRPVELGVVEVGWRLADTRGVDRYHVARGCITRHVISSAPACGP